MVGEKKVGTHDEEIDGEDKRLERESRFGTQGFVGCRVIQIDGTIDLSPAWAQRVQRILIYYNIAMKMAIKYSCYQSACGEFYEKVI